MAWDRESAQHSSTSGSRVGGTRIYPHIFLIHLPTATPIAISNFLALREARATKCQINATADAQSRRAKKCYPAQRMPPIARTTSRRAAGRPSMFLSGTSPSYFMLLRGMPTCPIDAILTQPNHYILIPRGKLEPSESPIATLRHRRRVRRVPRSDDVSEPASGFDNLDGEANPDSPDAIPTPSRGQEDELEVLRQKIAHVQR
ncbi:hypothetical protein B0H11DRAFT_1912370 [Mycena galericulata]|nr:hypothetical protein B0H11DRAFT_1912370 [Mycena galericulata]